MNDKRNVKRKLMTISMALLMIATAFGKNVIQAQAYSESGNVIEVNKNSESKYAASATFKGSGEGATDIEVTCYSKSNITIYKDNLVFADELLYSKRNTKNASYTAKFSYNNKYRIEISTCSGDKTTMLCNINQHIDTKKTKMGGIWTPKANSPITSTVTQIYQEKWFFSPEQCSEAVTYATSLKFLDYQTLIANGAITATGLLSGKAAAETGLKTLAVASGIVDIVGVFGLGFDFKGQLIDEIKEKGGYNEKTKKFSNGVVLIDCIANGNRLIIVEKWGGTIMKGAEGYVGTWSAYDAYK